MRRRRKVRKIRVKVYKKLLIIIIFLGFFLKDKSEVRLFVKKENVTKKM